MIASCSSSPRVTVASSDASASKFRRAAKVQGRRRPFSIVMSPASASASKLSSTTSIVSDRNSAALRCRASTSDDVDALPIEGIPPRRGGECDEEVCTVSPAVEATVRSLGRDVARCSGATTFFARTSGGGGGDNDTTKRPQRSTWTKIRFSPDVVYSDGFRSFKGVDGYSRLTWVRDVFFEPDVVSLFFFFFFVV